MQKNYRKTLIASYLGFITQALCANFAPLLFLRFHKIYGIPLGKIALISTTFFFTQLVVDLLCAKYVNRIGYRAMQRGALKVLPTFSTKAGIFFLSLLPDPLPVIRSRRKPLSSF